MSKDLEIKYGDKEIKEKLTDNYFHVNNGGCNIIINSNCSQYGEKLELLIEYNHMSSYNSTTSIMIGPEGLRELINEFTDVYNKTKDFNPGRYIARLDKSDH
jgi:hypothetical protein